MLFPSFGLDACQTQHETRGLHLPTDWKHEWIKTAHDSVPYIFVYHSYPVSPFSLAFLIILLPSLLSANFLILSLLLFFSCFFFFHLCIVYVYFCPTRTILSLVFILLVLYIDTDLYIFRFNLCIAYTSPCIYVNPLCN